MKLSKKDKEYLLQCGYDESDLAQIAAAASQTVLTLHGARISRKRAEELLGREALISGYARSAFHWTAVQGNDETQELVFFEAHRHFEPAFEDDRQIGHAEVDDHPRYRKTITISRAEADMINRYLTVEPLSKYECLSEDETILHTAVFGCGMEMDIKCCGVQYDEEEESNLAWAEAVLFHNGSEVACTEVSDTYTGEWSLFYRGAEYIADVRVADGETN